MKRSFRHLNNPDNEIDKIRLAYAIARIARKYPKAAWKVAKEVPRLTWHEYFGEKEKPDPNAKVQFVGYSKSAQEERRKRPIDFDHTTPHSKRRRHTIPDYYPPYSTSKDFIGPMPYVSKKWRRDQKQDSTNKYKATRTSSKVLSRRKSTKAISKTSAVKRFWKNRMPTMNLRTYPTFQGYQIAANSGQQEIGPVNNNNQDMENHIIGDKVFFGAILSKIQRDVMGYSGTTDGLYATDNTSMSINAANMHRAGLDVLKQKREYTMMNTCSARGFMEVWEFVWKGREIPINATTNYTTDQFHPGYLWSRDLLGDDPSNWGTSVTFANDANLTIKSLGCRPNSKSKLLNYYWRTEKVTRYEAGPGELITHVVNIPGFHLRPDELSPRGTTADNSQGNFIKGKTRFIMTIQYGQQGYEGSTGANNNARIETVPSVFNIRWRQHTIIRMTEASQKSYFSYTCPHDLATDPATRPEHSALVNPTVLLIDPADVTTFQDHDN